MMAYRKPGKRGKAYESGSFERVVKATRRRATRIERVYAWSMIALVVAVVSLAVVGAVTVTKFVRDCVQRSEP